MKRKLVYSTDRGEIVKRAREHGMTDAQVLKSLVANEYGVRVKQKIIREWAQHLGLTAKEAEEIAKKAGVL